MAKRKKTRTHQIQSDQQQQSNNQQQSNSPRSFIIKSTSNHHRRLNSKNNGTIKPHNFNSLNVLVRDFRKVMEPNTASKVKERKSNKFKDFLAMAGPLGVTHIVLFSQSSSVTSSSNSEGLGGDGYDDQVTISNINLKIVKVPRGPTLTFKVLRFSLINDILNCDQNPRSPGGEFKTEPLLIMNNFNPKPNSTVEESNHLNLLTTTFRNLFPRINIHQIQLTQTRRIVLLSYNPLTRTIDFRHYLIIINPIGVSKNIKRLIQGVNVTVNEKEGDGEGEGEDDDDGQTEGKGNDKKLRRKRKRRKILDLSNIDDVSEYVLGKFKRSSSVTSDETGFTDFKSENGSTMMEGKEGYERSSREDGGEGVDDQNGEEEQKERNETSEASETSDSETENEDSKAGDGDRRIELPQNYLGRGNKKNSRKSIRLKEIGPRLELGLIKIEEGLSNSNVLFHELIKKSKEEDLRIRTIAKEKELQRAERRKVQEENVRRKKAEKELKKQNKKSKRVRIEGDEEDEEGRGKQEKEEGDDDDEKDGEDDGDEKDDEEEDDDDEEEDYNFSDVDFDD